LTIIIYKKKNLSSRELPQLDPGRYGLTDSQIFDLKGILDAENVNQLNKLKHKLDQIYCGNVGAEFSYVQSEEEKDWLVENFENTQSQTIDEGTKKKIAELLLQSQAWDRFLATKFPTVKRYGGEGAESMMAFFKEILECSVQDDIKTIVLGMPHRGKLNLLTTMFKTRPSKIFKKFKGNPEFLGDADAMCDIASHFRECLKYVQ
jgi:probable 2-oxoglutarate dehydrogenase E1 component DHKTD1